MAGDYNELVGSAKQLFLNECTDWVTSIVEGVICIDVAPGSIVVTFASSSLELLEILLESWPSTGLCLPSYGCLTVLQSELLTLAPSPHPTLAPTPLTFAPTWYTCDGFDVADAQGSNCAEAMGQGEICSRICKDGTQPFGSYQCASGIMVGESICIGPGIADKEGLVVRRETKMAGEVSLALGSDSQISGQDLSLMVQEALWAAVVAQATAPPTPPSPTISPTNSTRTTSPTVNAGTERRLQFSSGGDCSNASSLFDVPFAIPLGEDQLFDSQSILEAIVRSLANRTAGAVCGSWKKGPVKVVDLVIRTATGEVFNGSAVEASTPTSSSDSDGGVMLLCGQLL